MRQAPAMKPEPTTVQVMTSIVEYSKTEAALSELASRYQDVQYDVATKDGMGLAIKARAELRGYRVALEKTRVEIKAPALKRTQEIDSEARRITSALSALEDPIDAQIKSEDMRKEKERLAAEQAIKDAERKKLDDERAEIDRRQAELDKAEMERAVKERESRRKIEEDERAARLKIEEEERKARAVREEQDRAARAIRQAEDDRLKAERDKVEAAKREVEEKLRKEQEAEAEKQREIQRQANDVLDARAMLLTFSQRFGHIKEFAEVVKAITTCLKKK